jgi:transcriptional regulator with XRE-family HTH domain
MEGWMIVTRESDIGEVVRRRRLALGLSQTQLAEQAATTRQWVSRLEQGRGDVTVSRLLAILDALALTTDVSPPRSAAPSASVAQSMIDPSILDALRRLPEGG